MVDENNFEKLLKDAHTLKQFGIKTNNSLIACNATKMIKILKEWRRSNEVDTINTR